MATASTSTKTRQRKHSFTSTISLLNRTRSMTDQTLLGVLNILRMDEGQGQTFMVKAILPDGKPRLLSAERNMTVRDLVVGICQEYNLTNYQVRTLPEKTLLNLEANATAVENAEIAIEDVDKMLSNFQLDNLHTIKDDRLRCVKELVYAEEVYNDCLKSLFELYAEPLRGKITRAEHHTLFATLEPICSLNSALYAKVEEAANNWNSASTGIGAIYAEFPLFWECYNDYYLAFKFARSLMRQKRENDSEFMAFVHNQRGSHRPQLDSLLLKPVQHVVECERILSNLLEKTPESHRDYTELGKVVSKFKQMVKDRDEEVVEAENECKIYDIQDRFPSDNLCLSEKQNSHRLKQGSSRRRSAPTTVIKAALGGKTHSIKSSTIDGSMRMKTSSEPTSPLSPEVFPYRAFIKEGHVQLSTGMSSQDRHLFLFDDLLLVAKPRSATFKLKHRVRVSEIWLASCLDDVCESTKAVDKSFVIGWPTTNFVAAFNTAEEKEAWHSVLSKQLKEQKDMEDPKSVSLKVYNRDMDSPEGYSKSFSVTNMDDAAAVVKMSLAQFQLQPDDLSEYQLWVLSGKEDGAYPLIGHEFPFAIKMNHMREAALTDEDGFPFDFDQELPIMDPLSPETQCQFILKRNRKIPNRIAIDVHTAPSKQRWKNPIKKSPIINWAMHKKTQGSTKGHSMDVQSSSPGKLFGIPLTQLCTEDEPVPKAVQELLLHLFRYGPNTTGIFRKSANARIAKEIKIELDEGKIVDFEDVSEVITASVLKEFLRRLPDCVFESENYEDLVATSNIVDQDERARQIKGILSGINRYNYELLKSFLCVLYHIADNAETNNMNAYNLAVCVAPSMLWAPKGCSIPATEQSNSVPPVIQFIIERCVDIMGDDVRTILGDRSEIAANHVASDSEGSTQDSRTALSQSSTDDGIESPEPLSPKGERTSLHLSDSNLYVTSTLSVHPPNKSVSTPSSPCDSGIPSPSSSPPLKRHDVEFSNKLSAAFYEPHHGKGHAPVGRRSSEPLGLPPDSMKLRLKGNRKFTNSKRQLSSTTTSAELIEHKQAQKTTASGRKLETAVLRRAHSPQTVRLFPVTESVTQYQRLCPVPNYPSSVARALEVKQSIQTQGLSTEDLDSSPTSPVPPSSPVSKQPPGGPRSPSPSPDQVFQAVDRRRQPAAPSYQEHMQRRRELNSKPAFFPGLEGKEVKDLDSNKEQISPRELKEFFEAKEHVQQPRFLGRTGVFHDRLDSERSETSSTPKTPLSPASQQDYVWEQVDDSSCSSIASAGIRRLEHSPFGLNLHHKRNASEGSYKKQPNENSRKTVGLPTSHSSGQLRSSPTCISSSVPNSVAHNSSLTHFPHSEFFPHEAQTKTHWGPSADSRGTSVVANSSCNFRIRRGSATSSSSSVSSLDERSSVGADSTFSEGKTDVTQIRDIKELLSENAQANGLKISPQTAQVIAKVRTPYPQSGAYAAPSHDDIEKILFTEESYV